MHVEHGLAPARALVRIARVVLGHHEPRVADDDFDILLGGAGAGVHAEYFAGRRAEIIVEEGA